MAKQDLARLLKALDAMPKSARKAIQPAIDKGADELVGRMKLLAPENEGELRDSIRSEPGPQPLSRTVFTDNDAALYQEYGTENMPASPYFWISERSLRKRVRGRIDRAIGKAIRDEWKK